MKKCTVCVCIEKKQGACAQEASLYNRSQNEEFFILKKKKKST